MGQPPSKNGVKEATTFMVHAHNHLFPTRHSCTAADGIDAGSLPLPPHSNAPRRPLSTQLRSIDASRCCFASSSSPPSPCLCKYNYTPPRRRVSVGVGCALVESAVTQSWHERRRRRMRTHNHVFSARQSRVAASDGILAIGCRAITKKPNAPSHWRRTQWTFMHARYYWIVPSTTRPRSSMCE